MKSTEKGDTQYYEPRCPKCDELMKIAETAELKTVIFCLECQISSIIELSPDDWWMPIADANSFLNRED